MSSRIKRYADEQRKAAEAALAHLAAELSAAGLKLPSACVDHGSPYTGVVLVSLGSAGAEVIEQLADVIRRGNERARP